MKRLLTTLVALVALIGTAWCAPVTKGAKVDLTSLLLRNNAGITHQSDAGKPVSRKNAPAVSPQSDPYITPVYSKVKAFPGDQIKVYVKTNVGDDVYSGKDNGLVRIDNPEIASLDEIVKWDDETYIYRFTAGSEVGETTIHISSPILNNAGLEATVSMEVTESFSPEDIAISFAPDTPETVVLGKPVDITVTYPEGWLDGYGITIWADSFFVDFDFIDIQTFAGRTVLTVIPKKNGEILLGVGPNSINWWNDNDYDIERTFNCETPDFVHTAGDVLNVEGISESGEIISTLVKKSEGVYAGTVSLDGKTSFRISVPTDNGDFILGSCFMRYYNSIEIQYGDRIVKANEGEETSLGRKYTLHDVTDYVPAKPDSYFIASGDSHGQALLTVYLNTMTARLLRSDLTPHITVDKPEIEIKALSEREFSVIVKTNVGDDLADGNLVNIDNPEVASFDRIERQDDETFRYVFRSRNIDGETKIHISSPILEAAGLEAAFTVTVTTTVNPKDIQLSFAPDTPETVACGTPVDITVTYPEGFLDDFDLWIDGGGFDVFEEQRNLGMRTYRMIAQNLGQVSLSVGSELHERLGLPRLERTFECVSPDYAKTAGEEIILNVRTNSGESNMSLSKKSEGVYGATVNLGGETAFLISVPTANGDVVLGGYGGNWGSDIFEFNDGWVIVSTGSDRPWGTQYTFQDVTGMYSHYLGTRNSGEYELTVDLNTMTATLRSVDFNPYITVEQPEIKVLSEMEFSVIVKSNVGDDIYDGERNGMIRIDNPELASFDRIECQDDETFRYVFRSGNTDGETKIHVSSPMLEEAGIEAVFTVTVTTTMNPEDIQLSFAPDTPETVVCGTPVDITVTYPEGWLDDFDLWLDGGFDVLEQQRNPGMRTYRMIAQNLGQVSLSVGSELHERLGLPRLERTFECVSPDYAQTAGEEIILNVLTNSGESVMYLSKKSEGVYGTTVNLGGETAFRISVPTANGDVVLGGYRGSGFDAFGFNDGWVSVFTGDDRPWGTQYTLQDVTGMHEYGLGSHYLGTRNNGEYELTVDLINMTASLMSVDFNPYIMVEQPEINVRGYNDFEVVVRTNVGDDVYVDADEYVTVDNPELIGLNWIDRRDEETYVYHFNTRMESGSTTIHISSPILREAGLEAVVNVTVGDFRTESVTLSSSEVTVGMGKYAVVSYSAEPFDEVWLDIENGNEDVCALVVDNDRRVFVLGKGVGESEIIFRPNDNPDVTATLKVTVLPADAKVGEHIVYTELEPEQRTRLYLDEHQDGSEAAPAWSSSDESVATVDADGRVTALKAGRAVITADCGVHQVMAGIHVKNSTDVDEVAESRVNVYSQGTAVTVVGIEEGDTVTVYAADGSLMTSRRSDGSALRIDLGVRGAFVVTAGSESFKVVL